MTMPTDRLLLARVTLRTMPLEALKVEMNAQLAPLDRIERLTQEIGQQRGDALQVFRRADCLAQDAVRAKSLERRSRMKGAS